MKAAPVAVVMLLFSGFGCVSDAGQSASVEGAPGNDARVDSMVEPNPDGATVQDLLFRGASSARNDSTATRKVLYMSATNRLTLVDSLRERALLWEVTAGEAWRMFWRSRNLYFAAPAVRMEDFNADGTTDLFWAMEFEELAGGMVVLNLDGESKEVLPDVRSCRAPEVHKDARGYLFVYHGPGALAADECRDMGIGCEPVSAVKTWPQYFRLDGDRLVEVYPAERYQAWADRFGTAAERLDSLYAAGGGQYGYAYEELCGVEMPQRLRALADSARRLAVR